jgi:hypothetical protein
VLARHERHEVQPVRADVADGPKRAAAIGLQSPVPVALKQEPVLEVASGHQPDLAKAALGDDLPCVLVERVVADVEIRRVHETALRRECHELGGFGGGHRERLLADDVLARGEDGAGLRHVEVVG